MRLEANWWSINNPFYNHLIILNMLGISGIIKTTYLINGAYMTYLKMLEAYIIYVYMLKGENRKLKGAPLIININSS